MERMPRKVAVIGVGNVGLGTALSILFQNAADELVLIDRNESKAQAEAWDMANAVNYLNKRVDVTLGSYADVKDMDIICIAAAAAPPAGGDRLAELALSSKITRSIVREAVDNGFNGIFIIETNPVDIMTKHALEESGFPANRVIGTGTTLDSSRLRQIIAKICDDVNVHSVKGYTMGEHGNSQAVIWSSVTVGGKSYLEMRKENPEKYAQKSLEELEKEVVQMAWDIINGKGCTAYGIGACTTRIIRAIFGDERSVIPVSAMLNGEYGYTGIVASTPAIIGKNGIEKVIELNMTSEEKIDLKRSLDLLQKYS
ncbi:MAG: L-lactate dehydrogenase [Brevinema sp.]